MKILQWLRRESSPGHLVALGATLASPLKNLRSNEFGQGAAGEINETTAEHKCSGRRLEVHGRSWIELGRLVRAAC
jgi:hypothetical protein